MQTLPIEISDRILASLSPSDHVEPFDESFPSASASAPGVAALAACSLANRSLSALARPHLFAQVRLWSSEHTLRLLGLMDVNARIIDWIKDLILDASRAHVLRPDDILLDAIPPVQWLSGPLGVTLTSHLRNVQVLRMTHFLGGLGVDNQMIANAWTNLMRLRTVVALQIEYCLLPSLPATIILLTVAYPKLRSLCLSQIACSDSGEPAPLPPTTIALPTLRCLQYVGPRLPGFDAGKQLLSAMRCQSLTRLHVYQNDVWHTVESRFAYVQGLLDHAPALKSLCLVGKLGVDEPLDLAANPCLECLAFHKVGIEIPRGAIWIAGTISSLSTPISLSRLEILGNLSQIEERNWKWLDTVLSEERFGSSPGVRELVVGHMEDVYRPLANADVARADMKCVLSLVTQLGWFDLAWTIIR